MTQALLRQIDDIFLKALMDDTYCPICHLEPAERYCEYCEGRFLSAISELRNMRDRLEADETFMAQFDNSREFIDYFVFEALVRLSSPFTGDFHENITTFKDAVGFGRQSILNSLKRLEERGMIRQFPDVDKKLPINKGAAILRVNDIADLAAPVYDYRLTPA